MKLLDFINQKSDNAYKDFKLVSVIFDEKKMQCTFRFLYKNELKENDKDVLKKHTQEYIGNDVEVLVKCKKAYVDESLVREIIYNFIRNEYNSVSIDFEKENIDVKIDELDGIEAKIRCTDFQYNYLNNPTHLKAISSHVESFFFEQFALQVVKDGSIEEIELSLPDESEILPPMEEKEEKVYKYNKVTNIKKYIGEVTNAPIKIECLTEAMENVEICGTIKFFELRSFTSKRKDKDGNAIVKEYVSFILDDGSARMNCVYFPLKSDVPKVPSIADEQVVLLHGDVEDFNGRINFKIKSLAYCEQLQEEKQESEEIKFIEEPNENYIYVKPQPYTEMIQDNLFTLNCRIGKYLQEHDVVVFDIETTGLELTKCEIIEIGAVRLVKGRMLETFSTLIKPAGKIPPEITDLTGISPDMVEKSPTIKQVLPDFYKFCYGATLMAYNIDFDYKFIETFGKKQGYHFGHEQIDVLLLARLHVPGLKNFKLSTVCKKLSIGLENAHRAVNDALATADVVIALSDKIESPKKRF